MSSTHAWARRSFASLRARFIFLFSRCIHSASTSSPRRSSKESSAVVGCPCCSSQAAASPSSRIVFSFSSVGSLSKMDLLSSVVVVAPAHVLVHERELWCRRRLGRREPVEAVLQDRLDVSVGAGAGDHGARARRLESI